MNDVETGSLSCKHFSKQQTVGKMPDYKLLSPDNSGTIQSSSLNPFFPAYLWNRPYNGDYFINDTQFNR